MYLIIPALTLGFLGSFHCIAMCGPIALSLPINSTSLFHKISHLILYNLGRVITYSLLGLLFGLIGQTFLFFGFQQYLSIALGVLILISIFFSSKLASKNKITSFFYSKIAFVKGKLLKLFQKKGWVSVFNIGLLNGLLPCGLVYMAIAGALATNNYLSGSLFMALFGLATIPVMLTLSLLGNIIHLKFRRTVKNAIPIILSVMAVLLILRGLNLGIPYVSPKINVEQNLGLNTTDIKCHK